MNEIPYVFSNGKQRRATVVPVDVSLEGLTDEEIQVLGHLSEASDAMTPIGAKQHYERILDLYGALLNLEETTSDEAVREQLSSYNTLFAARNSLWTANDGVGFRFPISRKDIPTNHPLKEFQELLINGVQAPPGRNFYPVGITDEELADLEEDFQVNSSIVRTEAGLRVELNENRYKTELRPVVESLIAARDANTNPSLENYLNAKITELFHGSKMLQERSDHAWLALEGNIDFMLGTGIETYLDKLKGVRGEAESKICRVNPEYQSFCSTIIDLLPELEQRAPWDCKRDIRADNMPKLRFVDVVTWSAGAESFPFTTLAQSLPNDQDFRENYGSVNVVFANIQEALSTGGSAKYIQDEFFLKEEMQRYEEEMGKMHIYMTAIHEIGHASGGVNIEQNPNDYFGKEYSRMEEARAELFSMWALPLLVERGKFTPQQEVAGYYSMASSLVKSLELAPNDHSGSRNMMFHYFLEKGGLKECEEEGKTKYVVHPENMRQAVKDMLGIIGTIRADGDKEGLERFKAQYLSTKQRDEFEKRLAHLPYGRLLIFPTMTQEEGRYTGELVMPSTYRGQTRTLNNFVNLPE